MRKRHRGHALTAPWSPDPDSARMEPMIDYFMERYYGLSGSHDALMELGQMVRAGVKLTQEIVDHVAKKNNIDTFKAWVDRNTPPKQTPAKPKSTSWVYFIRVGDRVKIGTSVNPAQRAVSLSLRVNNVLAVMEGGRKLEKSLHVKFAEHRIEDTEWFAWCDPIATFIDSCADPFTRDHRAYKPGAQSSRYDGHAALARRLDNGG